MNPVDIQNLAAWLYRKFCTYGPTELCDAPAWVRQAWTTAARETAAMVPAAALVPATDAEREAAIEAWQKQCEQLLRSTPLDHLSVCGAIIVANRLMRGAPKVAPAGEGLRREAVDEPEVGVWSDGHHHHWDSVNCTHCGVHRSLFASAPCPRQPAAPASTRNFADEASAYLRACREDRREVDIAYVEQLLRGTAPEPTAKAESGTEAALRKLCKMAGNSPSDYAFITPDDLRDLGLWRGE